MMIRMKWQDKKHIRRGRGQRGQTRGVARAYTWGRGGGGEGHGGGREREGKRGTRGSGIRPVHTTTGKGGANWWHVIIVVVVVVVVVVSSPT